MREIRLQGQADFIHRNRAAKINRQRSIRIAVDAPVLVRPAAVGVILVNVFHRVAGGKHGLSAGFHVGRSLRVKAVAAVAVIGIERQITPRGNLLRRGKMRAADGCWR